jgi:hypothetical protein
MHVIPQREIFDLAEVSDCSVLDVEPDRCVGTPGWMSNTFLVRKQRPGEPPTLQPVWCCVWAISLAWRISLGP